MGNQVRWELCPYTDREGVFAHVSLGIRFQARGGGWLLVSQQGMFTIKEAVDQRRSAKVKVKDSKLNCAPWFSRKLGPDPARQP